MWPAGQSLTKRESVNPPSFQCDCDISRFSGTSTAQRKLPHDYGVIIIIFA